MLAALPQICVASQARVASPGDEARCGGQHGGGEGDNPSYVLAVLAACANATSSVLQRKANREVPPNENLGLAADLVARRITRVRIVKRKLKKIQYRPHLIDGCLAVTGLEIEPW